VASDTGHPLERGAHPVLRRGRRSVGLLVLALSLISRASASHTATTASGAPSPVSFVIAADRIAGLRITPDTSYRRMVRYFARVGARGSSSFPEGLCRLRFEKIGLSTTFFTLDAGAATPASCTFFGMAVVTDSRWHTTTGLRVGGPLASLRRIYPRAYNSGRTTGRHWSIPTGSTEWWLTSHAPGHAAQPILIAYVRGGRVAALGINIVGH
jgi:hypothetical protein